MYFIHFTSLHLSIHDAFGEFKKLGISSLFCEQSKCVMIITMIKLYLYWTPVLYTGMVDSTTMYMYIDKFV